MRTFIILTLAFAVANSSFLRDLAATHKLSAITFGDGTTTCVLASAASWEVSATSDQALNSGDTLTFKATIKSGENTLTADTATAGASNKMTWDFDLTKAKTGAYKLNSVEDTGKTDIIELPEENTAFGVVTVAAEIGTQTSTETQEIKEGDETKGSFTIVFKAALDDAPVVFTASDGKTPIAACKVDTTTTTNLVCTPTKDEMKDGEEYTIHYQNGCGASPAGITSTGVKVKFVAAEEASAFMKLGKLVMIAVALLF